MMNKGRPSTALGGCMQLFWDSSAAMGRYMFPVMLVFLPQAALKDIASNFWMMKISHM